jgi:hypothetical protein
LQILNGKSTSEEDAPIVDLDEKEIENFNMDKEELEKYNVINIILYLKI